MCVLSRAGVAHVDVDTARLLQASSQPSPARAPPLLSTARRTASSTSSQLSSGARATRSALTMKEPQVPLLVFPCIHLFTLQIMN